MFIKKCQESIAFVHEWQKVYYDNFALLDDTPSKASNLEGFIEHRHDQSAFSLLAKLHAVPSVSGWECDQREWQQLKLYPILAKRDMKRTLLWRVLFYLRRLLKKKTTYNTYNTNI